MTVSSHNSPDFLSGFFVNHSLFHSTNADETVQRCTRALGSHRMRMQGAGNELNSSFNGLVCDDFAIVRLCHGFPVTIEPQVTDEYIVHHKLSGSGFVQDGATSIEMTAGVITVTSPGQETQVEMDSNSLHVVVRLPRKKVEEYVQNMLQQTIKRPVVFDTCMEPHGSIAASWANAMEHICDQYEILNRTPGIGPWVETAFAEYMIGLLLQVQPHNYSSRLAYQNGVLPSHYIRKARDYIHGHISEHISIATLAEATGVSARTLQTGFQRCFGQSPMEYLREQRIQYVHQELISAGPNTRVTDVFMKFGIYDFGRYAGFYRERYGTLPSERLKIRRLI